MNIITQYDNGTFEDVRANWADVNRTVINDNLTRSDVEFYEGAYSARLVTFIEPVPGNEIGGEELIGFDFIGLTINKPHLFTVRVKMDAVIGTDDAGELLFPVPVLPQSGDFEVLQIVAKNIADAEGEWVLLACWFTPKVASSIRININKIYSKEGYFPQHDGFYTQLLNRYTASGDTIDGNFLYFDAATLEEKDRFIPINDKASHIYHIENKFLLTYDGLIYDVEEPIKWDEIDINVIFDGDVFGYKYEFTDGDVPLEFDQRAGGEILRQAFLTDGVDAVASLKFGEVLSNGTLVINFEASLNFSTYKEDKNVVSMTIERQSFQDLIRSRWDTNTNIFRADTLDGQALPSLEQSDYWLHPSAIANDGVEKYNENISPIFDDIEEIIAPPLKIFRGGVTGIQDVSPAEIDLSPGSIGGANLTGQFIYTGTELPPGVTEVVVEVKARVNATITPNFNALNVFVGFEFVQADDVSALPTIGFTRVESVGQNVDFVNGVPQNIGGESSTFVFTLPVDSGLFIRMRVGNNSGLTDVEFTFLDDAFITIKELTSIEPVTRKTVKIFEALERQISIVTNERFRLKSNFFGRTDLGYAENGCGSQNVKASGKMIRGFDSILNMSMKKWVESLSAIYAVGMTIEREEDGTEFVRVEELPYFFQDVEVFSFDQVADYSKEANPDVIFNELEFGFKKFPNDNEANSIGEHLTRFQYLTPIKRVKKKLMKVADFILSTLYISLTKQESLRDEPTNSYETDDDVFMMDYQEAYLDASYEADFDATTKRITGDLTSFYALSAASTDKITITGSVSNNNTFTVASVIYDFINTVAIIVTAEDLVDESNANINITVDTGAGRLQSKRADDFETDNESDLVRNYNVIHHVKRILLRWAKLFVSGLKQKDINSRIRYVFGKNRVDFQTELKQAVTCNLDDYTSSRVQTDNVDSDLFDLNEQKSLFTGNIINFRWVVDWNDWNEMRKAYEGRSPKNTNFGYISVINPDGVKEKGHPISMKYQPVTQEIVGQLAEKGDWNA